LAAILIWNRIGLNNTLYPGDRLIVDLVGSRTGSH